jgi:HK97 family phage major capsid protein
MAKNAIPSNAAELEDMISDRSKVEKLVADGEFPDVMKAYAKTFLDSDEELKAQIKEQTQLAVANMLGEEKVTDRTARLNQTALANRGKGDNRVYNAKAVGARLDGTFDNFGDMIRANWHLGYKNRDREDLNAKLATAQGIMNSFGSTVPADGGFLIPEALRSEILSHSLEKSIVRPLATVIPMETLTVAIPSIDDTSHATNVFGGVQAYWTEENSAITESQAAFSRIKLEAEKLALYSEIPNVLLPQPASAGGPRLVRGRRLHRRHRCR